MVTSGGYVDFELLIESAGERYRAKVLEAPAGNGSESVFSVPEEVAFDGSGTRDGLFRGSRNLTVEESSQDLAREIGSELFRAVFAGRVGECWRESLAMARERHQHLRLKLRLGDDPRLLVVPWELFRDSAERFLAFDIPIVRTLAVPVERRSLFVQPPVRILVLLSSPPGVEELDWNEEWSQLDQALAPLVVRGEATLERLIQPTLSQIDEYLRDHECHVLHFVGHGFSGALVLNDSQGSARSVDHERLGRFFRHEPLRLVVLNACLGGRPEQGEPFSGVAQRLVRDGVPAVVAMQQEVDDRVSIAFTRFFYMALARGGTVAGSLAEARRQLWGESYQIEWANPVLYLNAEDGLVFPKPPDPPPPPPPPDWIRIVKISAAVLLLGLLGFAAWRLPSQPEPSSLLGSLPPRPPRSATENPEDCASPQDLNIAFEKIDGGIFEMGDERDRDTKPVHQVQITKSFCMGTYEVTRELWSRVRGTPAPRDEDRYLPVQGITFEEARQFLQELNRLDPSGHYRLPTEAEWEKAARAGQRTLYHFGDDEESLLSFGNCRGKDGFEELAPVGQLKPNPEGLYDMYGNVSEWVEGWHELYHEGRVTDPRGPVEGEKRIRRGGSWDSSAKTCSSAARSAVKPNRRSEETGLRIVREIR